MMTLPVAPWKHIVAKSVVSVLWMVMSGIAVTISGFILVPLKWSDVQALLEQMMRKTNGQGMLILLQVLLCIIVGLVASVLLVYAAISVGQLWSQHKLLGSFCAYVGICTVLQILGSILIINMAPFLENGWRSVLSTIHFSLLLMIAFCAAVGAAAFFGCQYMLTKRLNLD